MNPIILMIFLSYFTIMYQVFAVGTYGVTAMDLSILAFYTYALKLFIWDGKPLKLVLNGLNLSILAFLGASILSSVYPFMQGGAAHVSQYFKSMAHLWYIAIFPIVVSSLEIDDSTWTKIFKSWLILSIFINAFGIYQIFARAFNLPLAWLEYTNISYTSRGAIDISEFGQLSLQFENFFRATSIFTEPSALAQNNLRFLVMLMIPFAQRRQGFFKQKKLNVTIFIFILLASFLTFSLTGALGVFLLMVCLLVLERKDMIFKTMGVVALSFAFLIAADAIVASQTNQSVMELFLTRITSMFSGGKKAKKQVDGDSNSFRLESLKDDLKLWEKSPLTGIGLGLTQYDKTISIQYSNYSIAAALAETGIVGAVCFSLIFFFMGRESLKFILKPGIYESLSDEKKRILGLGFYFFVELFITNFISGNHLVGHEFWVICAYIVGPMHSAQLSLGNKHAKIYLVNKPLNQIVARNFNKYLESKN